MTSPKVSQEARELLPCPFCGGEADIVARNNPMSKWRWSVDCRGSTCGMSGPVESSRATAIALWNTRDEQLIRSKVIDEAAGEQWQDIETLESWRTDHIRTVLANWTSRGVCETYWDEDEDFDTRPRYWKSPREGWRSPGDMCIPVNQADVTHWRPLPAPPSIRQLGESGRP